MVEPPSPTVANLPMPAIVCTETDFHQACRYNSYSAHYQEVNCQRLAMEPLIFENGVDIVLSGKAEAPCLADLLP